MLLWPPLTGTQLSPVAPRSWFLPSGHTLGNRHDRRAKPGEVSGVVCVSTLGMSDSRTSHLPPLKKSYGGGDSNPEQPAGTEDGASRSGTGAAERRDAGVAFAIRNDIVGRPPCLPQGINDRLMSLCLPLRGDQFATIISAYAPLMTSSDAVKEKFYEDLHA
ncbi:unnamed protein product [Schistocephalus solidus]|uniref:Uncharacterized protein n=1 Tax=Schistocephalus solidus TaxID=70667 RepID=A0A183T369_SCHSO|nr:unnamed protein product [Schistocephalus solidus]